LLLQGVYNKAFSSCLQAMIEDAEKAGKITPGKVREGSWN